MTPLRRQLIYLQLPRPYRSKGNWRRCWPEIRIISSVRQNETRSYCSSLYATVNKSLWWSSSWNIPVVISRWLLVRSDLAMFVFTTCSMAKKYKKLVTCDEEVRNKYPSLKRSVSASQILLLATECISQIIRELYSSYRSVSIMAVVTSGASNATKWPLENAQSSAIGWFILNPSVLPTKSSVSRFCMGNGEIKNGQVELCLHKL